MIKTTKFEILRNVAGQFYWRYKASNGEIVAVSEAYTTKESCKNGIDSIKNGALFAEIEDLTI